MYDVNFILKKFLPSIDSQIEKRLGRKTVDMQPVYKRLESLYELLVLDYAEKRCITILAEVKYETWGYSNEKAIEETAKPTTWIVNVRKWKEFKLDVECG
jgi:hypothetical protein